MKANSLDRIELVFDRLIESLDCPISLRAADPDARMFNLVKLKIELIDAIPDDRSIPYHCRLRPGVSAYRAHQRTAALYRLRNQRRLTRFARHTVWQSRCCCGCRSLSADKFGNSFDRADIAGVLSEEKDWMVTFKSFLYYQSYQGVMVLYL